MEVIKFWKDEQRRAIDPLLFSRKAEDLAKEFAEENEANRGLNKRTQIRKFYDEVTRLEGLAKASPQDWDNILPNVHMLVAKTAYAEGRKLVSVNFTKFIQSSVDQVKTVQDLAVFANFFEAFMGFYRKHGPSN